jgi:hypothetical protein
MPFNWTDVIISTYSLCATLYYYMLYKGESILNGNINADIFTYIISGVFILLIVFLIKRNIMRKSAST